MMSIKTILVPVDGSRVCRRTLEAALALGRDFAAHVEALHVRSDPRDAVPLLGEGLSGSMVAEMIAMAKEETAGRAERARALFDELRMEAAIALADRPGDGGASAAFREESGREDDLVARRGRFADLVVVARPGPVEGGESALLNAALTECGCPVLAVPSEAAAAIGRRVAVAWNGSLEAARAVGAALPFLARAASVRVLLATDDELTEGAIHELVDRLAWHGIGAVARVVEPGPASVGERLLAAAADEESDLLVMGAYTHSRMRELIFGGVTRLMLERAPMPLLMVH